MNNNMKTIIGNPIPAPTWLWLKANNSAISVPVVPNGKGRMSITNKADSVKVIEDMTQVDMQPYSDINCAMGSELNEWRKEAVTGSRYIEFSSNESDEPEVITFVCDLQDGDEMAEEIKIYAKSGSNGTLVLDVHSPADASGFCSINVVCYLEADAKVTFDQVQLLGDKFNFVCDLSSNNQDRAVLDVTRVNLGAHNSWVGMKVGLRGTEADLNSNVAYMFNSDHIGDINDIAVHTGLKTTSSLEVEGVLMNQASKTYKGTIDLVHGCTGAAGQEHENVLMLSEDVINKSIPLILCDEEDVQGNHGATIGKLDDKILFYMRSRGIPEQIAKILVVKGKLEAMLSVIPDEEVVKTAKKYIKEKLDYEAGLF